MDIRGLCDIRPADLYDSDPMNMSREMVGECKSHGMGVTLSVTHFFGDMESEEANCYIQKEHQWSNRDTISPTTFQPKIFPVYKQCKDNGWIRDCGNGQPTGQT